MKSKAKPPAAKKATREATSPARQVSGQTEKVTQTALVQQVRSLYLFVRWWVLWLNYLTPQWPSFKAALEWEKPHIQKFAVQVGTLIGLFAVA